MPIELIKSVNAAAGEVSYAPYSMEGVTLLAGVPPVPLSAIESIVVYRDNPKTMMQMCLTGNGVFVNNRNLSGQIELTFMRESAASAVLQLFDLAGVPIPMYGTDGGTNGTSFFTTPACRQVQTPVWRKARKNGLAVLTFQAPKLIISAGVREIQ